MNQIGLDCVELHIQRSSHGVFSTSVGVSAAALASVLWQVKACPFQPGCTKVSRSFSTKNTQLLFFLAQESVMSIIPDQFPGIVFEPKKDMSFFPLQVVGSSNSKRFEVWVWVWWGQAGSVANGGWMIQKYTNTGETMLSFVCYFYYQRMSSKHCEFHFLTCSREKKTYPPKKTLPI